MYTNAVRAMINNTRTMVISTDNKANPAQNFLTLLDKRRNIINLHANAVRVFTRKKNVVLV